MAEERICPYCGEQMAWRDMAVIHVEKKPVFRHLKVCDHEYLCGIRQRKELRIYFSDTIDGVDCPDCLKLIEEI